MGVPSTSPVHVRSDQQRCAQLLRLARIEKLRALSSGDPNICIALLDGPVYRNHPCFKNARIDTGSELKAESSLAAIDHATCLASMLVGRGERVLGLCPDCTLLSFPIIDKHFQAGSLSPTVAAARISKAIMQAADSGASVIQLSLEFSTEFAKPFRQVGDALRYAAIRGVNTVMAAGNHPTLGGAEVLTAPGVVPVGMAGSDGMPHPSGALGASIGMRGSLAPGTDIPGAVMPDRYVRQAGSSYAASFVTATYALLRSQNPQKASTSIWEALLRPNVGLRHPNSIVPPRLDGDLALESLQRTLLCSQSNWVFKL